MNLRPFRVIALQCPRCGAEAALGDEGVACSACPATFPKRNGSLDFMGPYRHEAFDGNEIAALTETVRTVLSLPPQAEGEIASAVQATYERTGIAYIDAEIAALPSRFGAELAPAPDNPRENAPDGKNDDFELRFVSNHVPEIFAKGESLFRSFRVVAGRDIPDDGPGRIGLSAIWVKIGGGLPWRRLLNAVLGRDAPVSWMPVPVAKGREITVPVKITVPSEKGDYRLTIHAVGTRKPARVTLRVKVADGPDRLPVHSGYADYGSDHAAAVEFVQAFLAGRPSMTLLEVASGVNPHLLPLAAAGHRVIASDVCSNQMQLGMIFTRYIHSETVRENLGFASFDAFNPPFAPKQFDGVTMFAALHHFPDPVAFLSRLAQMVKPGGFIAVLCEPCDPAAVGEAYRRDLAASINEQVFSVEEYREIFSRAKLREGEIRNDNGSLKAILLV